jgi:hypothetical protein
MSQNNARGIEMRLEIRKTNVPLTHPSRSVSTASTVVVGSEVELILQSTVLKEGISEKERRT